MTPVEKKAVDQPGPPAAPAVTDPEFMQALLAAHRQLEIPELLRALLEPVRKWTGAEFGIGLGASGEGRALIPLAASTSMEDERAREIGRAHV